jgi:bifunctional non-homologous end joining protein LigD
VDARNRIKPARARKDPLKDYAGKRDFSRTAEPKPQRAPKRPAKAAALRFVVQKHAARRTHYDLRLELDGVLKSWAVTRGPSLAVGDKRLAVRTEDHPISRATFPRANTAAAP